MWLANNTFFQPTLSMEAVSVFCIEKGGVISPLHNTQVSAPKRSCSNTDMWEMSFFRVKKRVVSSFCNCYSRQTYT